MPFDFGNEQINVDDWVSATCIINKGDLPVDINWFMTDDFGNERKLITNDGIVITSTNQRTSMLTIEAVKPRHRATYACIAKNKAGISQLSAQLTINGDYEEFL